VARKLLDKALNKINRLVAAVVFATTKDSSNVIPGLTYKAQQGLPLREAALYCFLSFMIKSKFKALI